MHSVLIKAMIAKEYKYYGRRRDDGSNIFHFNSILRLAMVGVESIHKNAGKDDT